MSNKKSLSKKSNPILWYNCEKCFVNITMKDRDDHENLCPISPEISPNLSFIKDKIMYINNVEKNKLSSELKDINKKHLNSLIFISESAIRLCGFYIGQKVSISSSKSDNVLVRLCWPFPDKFLNTVFVTETDYDENWINFQNCQLKIEKLSSDPKPVDELILKHEDLLEEIDDNTINDITKVLKKQLLNLVYCWKNRITLNFFNKKIIFTISSYKLQNTDINEKNAYEMLQNKLQNLHLQSNNDIDFLLITQKTVIKILREQKSSTKEIQSMKCATKITKQNIGGLDNVINVLEENINIACDISSRFSYDFKISRGILLFGPSGCGKSMICEAIANEYESKAQIIKINTSEIFSKFFGETERNLKNYFDLALQAYPQPTIIIIEDINNICPKNETNQVVKRVSIALLNLIDSLHFRNEGNRIFVIATIGSLELLNQSLRRCGRFDTEIEIPAPNSIARKLILEKQLSRMEHGLSNDDIKKVADVTHGFVGSDLSNLIYKAAVHSLNQNLLILDHINYALTQVKPSAMREVHIESPNVKWSDIGGQNDLKLKLKQAIEWPLLFPEKFLLLGIQPPRGVLMFGPPGCSKTMIAKALATESKVNFLSIKGPELFSMWVGESERAVREVFRKARQVAPSIIFFDEIDAIGGERSSDGGSSSVKERVLTQLLTELDGVDALKNVTVVAATNRPDMCDKALLRPGRIDRIVYVGLPDEKTRKEIFEIKLKKMPINENVQIENLIKNTEGYSGAEIEAVCHEAALKVLEENFNAKEVKWEHFEFALKIIPPRTSKELMKIYDDYRKQK